MSMTPEERKVRRAEYQRQYLEANKEKVAEQRRQYRESNKEKVAEQNRRYLEVNKDKAAEQKRRYHEANKEAMAKKNRRYCRRKGFARENGSSFQAWLESIKNPNCIFAAIANLQPDPGQTLAELIHELSGYAMEVCEQIANPSVIEDSPALTPPAALDLF